MGLGPMDRVEVILPLNKPGLQVVAARASTRSFAVDHTLLMTAPDLVIDVIVEAARENLSLAPLQMLGEPKWTAADPQLKKIRK